MKKTKQKPDNHFKKECEKTFYDTRDRLEVLRRKVKKGRDLLEFGNLVDSLEKMSADILKQVEDLVEKMRKEDE